MARAFLVVMDSVGIGGAPDADAFFNGSSPDTGSNTLGHIVPGRVHIVCAEAVRFRFMRSAEWQDHTKLERSATEQTDFIAVATKRFRGADRN